MSKNSHRFTPSSIGENYLFSIPLYQRLFEWEEAQVTQLLSDLYASFLISAQQPYHIGVLTVFYDKLLKRYSLVDGQQRFTVLMLLGIVLEWEAFLKVNGGLRLSFFARDQDENYLKATIEKKSKATFVNKKMEDAIGYIRQFLNKDLKDIDAFKTYIKDQTTFFISELPNTYTPIELNRYFEAMNEAGKGLENHEILKVRLLGNLDEAVDLSYYTKIWNQVSEMDKCLIRQEEKESIEQFKKRYFDHFLNPSALFKPTSEADSETNTSKKTENTKKTIKDIQAKNIKPNSNHRVREEGAVVDFVEFLLLVLQLTLADKKTQSITDFFKKNKLLETFKNQQLSSEDSKLFLDNLLKYRLLFDYFIIRRNSQDHRSNTYTLHFSDESSSNKEIIQYQSMLYVSISYYIWLLPLFQQLKQFLEKPTPENFSFLTYLKEWDNNRLVGTPPVLKYGSIDRYWFWRLDYYLWEERSVFFKDKSLRIANNYVFKSNRSIEHIAPQTPKTESNIKLNDDLLHVFGNLAMISSGQNSSLKNKSFEIKKAHVSSFVNKSVIGSIESLKLLKIFTCDTWNEKLLKEHHNEMIDVLIKSFGNEEKFTSLKTNLELQKLM